MTKFRVFVIALAAFLTSAWVANDIPAQQPPPIARVGVLIPYGDSSLKDGFRDALHQAGYIEGTNMVIDWRVSTGTAEDLRSIAIELVQSKVDLIVSGGSPATRAVLQTTTLPVVFISGDPVAAGFAASLAKPGGNCTGVSVLSPELESKRLGVC